VIGHNFSGLAEAYLRSLPKSLRIGYISPQRAQRPQRFGFEERPFAVSAASAFQPFPEKTQPGGQTLRRSR
jgi:hypothetical protein